MESFRVDPRDTTWEQDSPTYRVYFWGHPQHPSDEWRLTGAQSVFEVIAWAERNAGIHRTYQVWIEARDEQGDHYPRTTVAFHRWSAR